MFSFRTSYPILCLQVEANDNIASNVASDISNMSTNVTNSSVPAVRQVSNFISNSFVTHDS